MLSILDFAHKAIKHRKFQPILALLGLIICVASTIFLILLGQILGENKGPANFLSSLTSKFIYLDTVLIFFTGMVIIVFLFSAMMVDRKTDTGLIKALGSVENLGFGYVMSEPLLIIIYGCLLGGLIGSASFAIYSVIYFPLDFFQAVVYVFIILGLLIVFFASSWFISGREAEKMFKITPTSLFSGDAQNYDFVKEQITGIKKFLDRLPWAFQVVTKSMIRSQSKSKIALVSLVLSIFLMTVSLVGGIVSWSTTRSYVDNSFGQNVIAISNREVSDAFTTIATTSLNSKDSSPQEFNFLEPEFNINSDFVDKIKTIPGVSIVDARLIVFTQVQEVQTFEIVQDMDGSHYVSYGQINPRSSNSLIVGVNPDSSSSDLLAKNIDAKSNTSVVGSSLAETILDQPLKQKIMVFSNSSVNVDLAISSVAYDPLNSGYVVYVPLGVLQSLNLPIEQNLVLVKLQNNSVISSITSLADEYNLTVVNMDSVRQKSLSNVDNIWLSILPFPLLSVITAMVGLLNCMSVSFSGRQHDFGILKAMGAKDSFAAKIVFLESLTLIALTAPIGVSVGMIFNLFFLLSEATISPEVLLLSICGLSLLLFGMCCLTTIIVLKLNKQLPVRLIQKAK